MLKIIHKTISIIVLLTFISTSIKLPAYAQGPQDHMLLLPAPGVMLHLSPTFNPAFLKGIIIHPENALKIDFIIYKGDEVLSDAQKRREYTKLVKYFLASLAITDDDQWVNLSPYEKDRIIKEDFGRTEMGRDLLSQDYILKQITASLIYPQDKLGQKFWDKVYSQAYKQFGTTNIPVNTFNKVWIVPDDAEIYEKGNMAYVVKNHLKVMLEEDYLSLEKHSALNFTVIPAKAGIQSQENKVHTLASQVVREIILPALEKEVNEGKNFAVLRQVFSGVVLAAWYKRALKESFLGQIYMNKSRLKGVDQDPKNNEIIYQRYLMAFKKGVFNYIKEDVDKYTNETVPKKYFSGGILAAKYTSGRNLFTKPFSRITSAQRTEAAMDASREEVGTFEMSDGSFVSPKTARAGKFASTKTAAMTVVSRLIGDREVVIENPTSNLLSHEQVEILTKFASQEIRDFLFRVNFDPENFPDVPPDIKQVATDYQKDPGQFEDQDLIHSRRDVHIELRGATHGGEAMQVVIIGITGNYRLEIQSRLQLLRKTIIGIDMPEIIPPEEARHLYGTLTPDERKIAEKFFVGMEHNNRIPEGDSNENLSRRISKIIRQIYEYYPKIAEVYQHLIPYMMVHVWENNEVDSLEFDFMQEPNTSLRYVPARALGEKITSLFTRKSQLKEPAFDRELNEQRLLMFYL